MSCEQHCQIVRNARKLAKSQNLDPYLVNCSGSIDGACPFEPEREIYWTPEDVRQNEQVARVEGSENVARFEARLKNTAAKLGIISNR